MLLDKQFYGSGVLNYIRVQSMYLVFRRLGMSRLKQVVNQSIVSSDIVSNFFTRGGVGSDCSRPLFFSFRREKYGSWTLFFHILYFSLKLYILLPSQLSFMLKLTITLLKSSF